jgi:hypothetical protein
VTKDNSTMIGNTRVGSMPNPPRRVDLTSSARQAAAATDRRPGNESIQGCFVGGNQAGVRVGEVASHH